MPERVILLEDDVKDRLTRLHNLMENHRLTLEALSNQLVYELKKQGIDPESDGYQVDLTRGYLRLYTPEQGIIPDILSTGDQ